MNRAVVIVAVALVMALSAPSVAHAGWRLDRSLAIAQAVWHPACGPLSVAYADPTTLGVADEAGGWAWAGDCRIGLDSRKHLAFEQLCTVVLHEAGHVAGAGHSANRESVMFAEPLVIKTVARIGRRTIVRWNGADPRCLHRGRAFLERHGLL